MIKLFEDFINEGNGPYEGDIVSTYGGGDEYQVIDRYIPNRAKDAVEFFNDNSNIPFEDYIDYKKGSKEYKELAEELSKHMIIVGIPEGKHRGEVLVLPYYNENGYTELLDFGMFT